MNRTAIAVAMFNVAEVSQNAYPALAFQAFSCPKRSDQSYIQGKAAFDESLLTESGFV